MNPNNNKNKRKHKYISQAKLGEKKSYRGPVVSRRGHQNCRFGSIAKNATQPHETFGRIADLVVFFRHVAGSQKAAHTF
jgi:hypothetical protein